MTVTFFAEREQLYQRFVMSSNGQEGFEPWHKLLAQAVECNFGLAFVRLVRLLPRSREWRCCFQTVSCVWLLSEADLLEL